MPTIILTGDADKYPSMTGVWPTVGTVEDDGAYIFRKVEVLRQTYKDLTTGEVVSSS